MATPKKTVSKTANNKKPVEAPAKKKPAVNNISAAKSESTPQKGNGVKKADSAKESTASGNSTKSSAKPEVAVKKTADKSAIVKKAIPAKALVPVKAAPVKKAAPVAKKEAAKPVIIKAPVAKPAPAPKNVKKEPIQAAPPAVKVLSEAQQAKKETKAQQKAALKRTASAVQRVQAKVAASIPKPQPKPAPMPTIMPGRDEKKSNTVIAHRRLEAKPKDEEDTSITMINYQPDFTRSILDRGEKESGPIYRYSDDELAEFRELITNRLATARKELTYQQGLITHKDATGTEDTENRFNSMEDGSGAMEREQLAQLASRQIQFINHLEKAMIRIENKTYGICRVTGKLIDKARLRAVPHATLSIEAKNMMNK